ncbi:MAG: hypothetical protein NTX50_02655 [Candidatus Sumerlaeota bacterium]|nr:hypothetical protein [Candidatus Sumerlaeota bacterium]
MGKKIPNLEDHLLMLSKENEGARSLQAKYEATKIYLETQYYPWIQATCPYYTDHGQRHVQSIIQAASTLTGSARLPQSMSCWDEYHIYCLLTSILWHDIGMVLERSNHAENSVKAMEAVRECLLPDTTVFNTVSDIVKAHSGQQGLRIPKPSQDITCPVTMATFILKPKAIAAALRFADEISETRHRISTALLDSVPAEHRLYWEYANCIEACRPDSARNRVVLTMEMDIQKAITSYYDPAVKKEIQLIEYAILRLQKLNEERAYCNDWFEGFATPMQATELRLTVKRNHETIWSTNGNPIIFADSGLKAQDEYPSIPVFNDFFRQYPDLQPDNLKRSV